MKKTKRNKQHEKVLRDLLKELPYFNCKRNLAGFHGRFNNLLQSNIRSKRYLDKLTSLYELDLFKLNTLCNSDVNTIDNLYNQGPCTVRPTLFLIFLFHVEQTERYEIDIFFD